MDKKKRIIASIIIFIIFLGLVYLAYSSLSENFDKDDEIQPPGDASLQDSSEHKAPDFIVLDDEGNEVSLSDYFGEPIVLNFWASWCPPCREEMPYFDEAYADVKDDVVFMMIDLVDGRRETIEQGQSFINDHGFDLPVYFDDQQDAAIVYEISSIPTTIFIDKDGNIVFSYTGPLDKESLLKGIELIR